MNNNKEHKCGKIPGQLEVIYNPLWNHWAVYRLLTAVLREITYCPWCGVRLSDA